jgi:hypothetical protein
MKPSVIQVFQPELVEVKGRAAEKLVPEDGTSTQKARRIEKEWTRGPGRTCSPARRNVRLYELPLKSLSHFSSVTTWSTPISSKATPMPIFSCE